MNTYRCDKVENEFILVGSTEANPIWTSLPPYYHFTLQCQNEHFLFQMVVYKRHNVVMLFHCICSRRVRIRLDGFLPVVLILLCPGTSCVKNDKVDSRTV